MPGIERGPKSPGRFRLAFFRKPDTFRAMKNLIALFAALFALSSLTGCASKEKKACPTDGKTCCTKKTS